MHVTLSIIEHHTFRDLILYIYLAFKPFFAKTGNII
jgi:hypothetical protein